MAASCKSSVQQQQRRDWAWGLPGSVLCLTADRLTVVDFMCFRSVCKSWSSMLRHKQVSLLRPMLMLPHSKDYWDFKCATSTRTFLNIPDGRFFRFTSQEFLGRSIVGSSRGWLVLVDVKSGELFLLQPLTGDQIPLKPFLYDKFADAVANLIEKVVLSCNPTAKNCIVVLMFNYYSMKLRKNSKGVSYARIGDSSWTNIDMEINGIDFINPHTLIVLKNHGKVLAVDFRKSEHQTKKVPQVRRSIDCVHGDMYLVPCEGELFAVLTGKFVDGEYQYHSSSETYMESESSTVSKISVYKLIADAKYGFWYRRWKRSRDLEGHAFFVGRNNSVSVALKDMPAGMKKNCIYFTDCPWDLLLETGCSYKENDVAVYDLEEGVLEICVPSWISLVTCPPELPSCPLIDF